MKPIQRSYTTTIQKLLKLFPCVAVLGARQVGKTTLLKQTLPSVPFFDLENNQIYQRITADPLFFLENYKPDTPIIIDEAQLSPELFQALRIKIDEHRNVKGRFLISGSSSPELLKNVSESLAGRVAILELGGLLWHEALEREVSPIYNIIFLRIKILQI